jgi:phage FluMu gp28-like protein
MDGQLSVFTFKHWKSACGAQFFLSPVVLLLAGGAVLAQSGQGGYLGEAAGRGFGSRVSGE